jgi:hypothetical protein
MEITAGILDRAMLIIAPTSNLKPVCAQEIKSSVLKLLIAKGIEQRQRPPGTALKALRKLHKALRAVEIAESELSFPYALWPGFMDRVAKQRRGVEKVIKGIVIRPGSLRRSYTKYHAVKFAHELLSTFGRTPRLTAGSAWPQLASVLYEGAFRISNVDLFEYCRDYRHDLLGGWRPRP